MAAVVEAIAIGTPIIASNAIFATRRFSRGVDAMDNNIFEGIGDIGLCAGQTLKGFDALHQIFEDAAKDADNISKYSSAGEIKRISSAEASSKECAKLLNRVSGAVKTAKESSKFFGGICSAVENISKNINPVIYAVGGIKVLGAKKDDRLDAAAIEASALTAMRVGEESYKKILGWKDVEQNETAKKVIDTVKTKLKKNDAIVKFAEKNPSLIRSSKGIAKGVLFALTSIEGYKLGKKGALHFIGKEEPKASKQSV